MPRINEKKCNELFDSQCFEIKEISEYYKLSDNQNLVKKSVITNNPYISDNLKNELNSFQKPFYYLDFETFKTAYPIYPGLAPHEQVATQYSLHKLNNFEEGLTHTEYLANPKHDCRRELIENLIQSVGEHGSIIVYSSFEKNVFNSLKNNFSDLDQSINAIISRLIDLQRIIQEGYYHPGFHGSYSIKNVLPVLVPNMNYESLDIKNGDMAVAVFARMTKPGLTTDQVGLLRNQLLQYCCQDTLAMVELHKQLFLISNIQK